MSKESYPRSFPGLGDCWICHKRIGCGPPVHKTDEGYCHLYCACTLGIVPWKVYEDYRERRAQSLIDMVFRDIIKKEFDES